MVGTWFLEITARLTMGKWTVRELKRVLLFGLMAWECVSKRDCSTDRRLTHTPV